MATTSTPAPPLGNLLRLHPLSLAELPAHPSLTTTTSKPPTPTPRPPLPTFLTALLSEATTFADHNLPTTFHVSSTSKRSPPATSPITLLKHTYAPSTLVSIPWPTSPIPRSPPPTPPRSEAWFARRSTHADAAAAGTASWAEFDAGLRAQHSEHERAYTPDVYAAQRVLDWDAETETESVGAQLAAHGFRAVRLRLYEICHRLPFPLRPRVFAVAVATAVTAGTGAGGAEGFVVVQVPVDMCGLAAARYTNGGNVGVGRGVEGKRCVGGRYVSVERVRRGKGGEGVEWVMGTASDAGGWLPMWVQKMGVPGAVVKDVGLFVGWVEKERRGGGS
ncbi:hypothetical protein MMC26_001320 [Xylographa opegraphella]|nr:hypothetical protein [Xylographa opegraphella]